MNAYDSNKKKIIEISTQENLNLLRPAEKFQNKFDESNDLVIKVLNFMLLQ